MAELPEYRPYDDLPVGALSIRSGQVVYANSAAGAIFHLPLEELLGRSSRELAMDTVTPAERPAVVEMAEAGARGERTPDDTWVSLAPPGGPERSVRLIRLPAPVPGDDLFILVTSETETESRRTAEAMVVASAEFLRCREEQEVLDAAVRALHEQGFLITIMQLVDGELVIRAIRQDPGMLQRGSELYGKPAAEVRFDPRKVPHFEWMMTHRRAVFLQDPFALMDRIHRADVAQMMRATMPHLRLVDTPIFVEGAPFGVMNVAAAQLTPGSAATLELFGQLVASGLENVRHLRRSRERLQELTRLQQELVSRERLAAIGEAAGVLSHEARNPLGAILNALAVLRRSARLGSDDQLVLDIAEEESLRLDALVRDLLELARPLEPRARPVRVDGVVDAVINDFTRRRARAIPELKLAAEPSLPDGLADATLLRLAVENLLRNALQAGGGLPVQLSVSREAEWLVVAVSHSGAPRPLAESTASFDPFSVAQAGGTGLGLAVVKRVIEAQRGQVRAREGGTRLELLLPVAGESDA